MPKKPVEKGDATTRFEDHFEALKTGVSRIKNSMEEMTGTQPSMRDKSNGTSPTVGFKGTRHLDEGSLDRGQQETRFRHENRLKKLKMPTFDGDNPDGWILQAKRVLAFAMITTKKRRLKRLSFHFLATPCFAGAKKTSTRTFLANSTTKVGKLTSSEIQHIQQKGLCFRYDDKWSLRHCWKKRKLQVIIVLEDVEENGFDNETKDDGVDAIDLDTIEVHKSIEVSYQFVTGLSSNSTMKLKGQLGTKKVLILINSKATHNFISKSLVTKLHIPIVETKANEVTMGNGDSMKCEGICKNLNIHFQRVDIWDDFLPLPLGSADIILGLQWLTTLGMTKTNLTEQTMEFQLGEQSVTIRGNSSLNRSLASLKTMAKTLQAEKQVIVHKTMSFFSP
uniref:Ty3-gypsy retrotransposon protein n=1 Tax=Cannabis sativa TaxID=3483 RepID=A0A803QCP9_CANSA